MKALKTLNGYCALFSNRVEQVSERLEMKKDVVFKQVRDDTDQLQRTVCFVTRTFGAFRIIQ